MLSKLFSIRECGSRKVINILGIKIKTLNIKHELRQTNLVNNRNMIAMLYTQFNSCAEEELFGLKLDDILFIFNKGCLKLDYDFFQDYLLPAGYAHKKIQLLILDKNSPLYKEHLPRISKGEFLWKYTDRLYFIAHSFISTDENGDVYINSSYIEDENRIKSEHKIQHIPMNSRRKYIQGITAAEYLNGKSQDEKFIIIKQLLDYVFSEYKDSENPQKVSGDLFDCHLSNFLVGKDGKFHFIDFDLKCNEALDRAFCVYFMLYNYDITLYKKLLETYQLEDKHLYYEKNFTMHNQPRVQNGKSIITSTHIKLQEKYFGGQGLKPEIELKV